MPLKNERGMTLVEALAAALILGMVAVIFANVSGYTLQSIRKTDHSAEAQRIAEENLNYARSHYRANNAIPSPLTAPQGFVIDIQVTDLSASPADYDTSTFGPNHVSLQSVVYSAVKPLRLLTVTVSWEE